MIRLALALVLVSTLVHAHSFDPTLLDLREREAGVYDVVWRTIVPQGADVVPVRQLVPEVGEGCRRVDTLDPPGDGPVVFRVDCRPDTLRGQRIGIAGLDEHPTDVLLRVAWADGDITTGVLSRGAASLDLPRQGGGAPLAAVLWRYGVLGVEHILGGIDHLAFVLGLLLLVHGWWRLVETVTAFTIAHTCTLALAVLGVLHVPSAPVEAMIALSIVVVAVEALRAPDAPPTLAQRAPWCIAFLFGLLHGLGFAGALAELGLPPDHVPAALLAFNAGVELGQLTFVAVMLAPVALLRRMPRGQAAAAYGVGAVAVAWTLERVAAFWA